MRPATSRSMRVKSRISWHGSRWARLILAKVRPAAVPQISSYDWDKARRHWAFQPVHVVEPPSVKVERNKSPIDRFIKTTLDEKV
jgi:hypothetical protein